MTEPAPTRQSTWHGMLWPMLCMTGGLIAYFLLFGFLVDPLSPPADAIKGTTFRFLWETEIPPSRASVLAADINARYAQAIPSVLMTLAFGATVAVAFVVVLPPFGRNAMILGALVLPVGGAMGYFEQYNNPLRAAVTNCNPASGNTFCPLDQAVLRAGDLGVFTEQSLAQIRLLTHWNSILSVAAIFLLAICFLFIARRAEANELDPRELRTRRQCLTATILLGGLVLVFSVATAHAFYHLAPSLMAHEDAGPFAELALAGSTYWGAVYTSVIIVIAVPAWASISHDITRATQRHAPHANHAEQEKWRQQHGLSLELRDALGPIIASVTPVLTAPALNVLKPLLIGGG